MVEKHGTRSSGDRSTDRWEVKIVRESQEEATIYVSGRTKLEAEEVAERDFEDGGIYEFETIWSEYTIEVSRVDPGHDAYPIAGPDGGHTCKMCLQPVTWTGISADDPRNTSGKTIPGPWVHT